MRKWTGFICLAVALSLVPSGAEAAGGSSSPPPPPPLSVPQSPEASARDSYNMGLKYRDKAWKLEEKAAASSTDAERRKLEGKVRKQYDKAKRMFLSATEKVPGFYQAFSSLGYAYRKTGEFEKSLAAYDRALELSPAYGEAIEYRAEAYLGLGRVDDARKAYMHLFGRDRALADELMEAMQDWAAERREDPAGIAGETLEGFDAWIKERGEIADQTAQLAGAADRAW